MDELTEIVRIQLQKVGEDGGLPGYGGDDFDFRGLPPWRGVRGAVLVDLVGIEPTTSSMPWKRAPSCATGPLRVFNYLGRIDFLTPR